MAKENIFYSDSKFSKLRQILKGTNSDLSESFCVEYLLKCDIKRMVFTFIEKLLCFENKAIYNSSKDTNPNHCNVKYKSG